jgi:hypothetical protein
MSTIDPSAPGSGASLIELGRKVLTPLDAPASFLASHIVGPDFGEEAADVDEWLALDSAVALRIAQSGSHVVLRLGPGAESLATAPRLAGLEIEAVLSGADGDRMAESLRAIGAALDDGLPIRAVFATGTTGFDAYRAAAAARQALGTRVAIRVRWDDVVDVKGAALALSFGADELAGPLAPEPARLKLAQLGGPPEDVHTPSPWYVEQLIRAAGRLPSRRNHHKKAGAPARGAL